MTSSSEEQRKPGRAEMVEARKMQNFGVSGYEELRSLEAGLDAARDIAENDPENEQTQQELRIAELKFELFRREHDNAGAFKFNRFGRELRTWFEPGPDGRAEMQIDEEGQLELSERAANRRMIIVNMGELDRFNKEGGHAAGDAGLSQTAHAIESIVMEELERIEGEGVGYQMTRFSGNEFMVTLDGVSESEAQAIIDKIEAKKPTVEGVSEGAPLTAGAVGMRQAAEIFNALQAELPPADRLTDPDDINRELVEVVKNYGGYLLEVEKFTSRVGRMLEIFNREESEEARKFFDNYLAKMFKGSGLDSIEDFERLASRDSHEWADEVDRMALESARRRYADDKEFLSVRDDIIRGRVRELSTGLNVLTANDRLQSPNDGIAAIPEFTAGQMAVQEKRRILEELPEDASDNEREILRLEWQTEDARRDRGTGLLDRGSYYGRLEQSIENKEEVSVVFVDMAFLKYFDQKGGSDVGDSALKAAAEIMERAVKKTGIEAEVYRYGGDEFMVRVGGGDVQVKRLIAEIQSERDIMGKIPGGVRSQSDYAPTKLSFNYGACDNALLEAVRADLERAGQIGPDLDANAQAELMTIIADRSIEEEKAVDRFQLLIRELRDPAYQDDPERKAQVDALIQFSQKAIFSETGGSDDLRRLAGNLELSGAELDEEIRETVLRHIDQKREKDEGKDRLMESLIDLHVQIRQLSDRLRRVEGDYEAQKEIAEKLRARLAKAEDERSQLLSVREQID